MKNTFIFPSKKDWGVMSSQDLDFKAAVEFYFGKTTFEMEPFLINHTIDAIDYLRYMPGRPFRYYTRGYCRFILDKKFEKFRFIDLGSLFSGMLSLLEEKALEDKKILLQIVDVVIPTAIFIANEQNNYEISDEQDNYDPYKDIRESIYGDFNIKKDIILNALKSKI
ncbi:hypothetical protein RHO12_02990 [Orbus sturtevantii]|uniref:hypothetical protein n=1 Tax=Orbus sturtevantii TaxID=3074109 RepID=UPI00370DA6E7